MVSISQPRNRLEDRRSTDDEMSREMWKEIEDRKIEEGRIAETETETERREERDKKAVLWIN